jgi:hypothetical protein
MPSTFTPLLRLTKPGLNDTGWGTTVNNGTFELVDNSLAGLVSVDVTSGNATLTTANGATDQARYMFVRAFGASVARDVVVPATSKLYFVINDCTAAVTFKASGQTGVSIPAGRTAVLRCNGTDVVAAVTYLTELTSGGTATATKLIPTGNVTAGNGMYLPATNELAWSVNGAEQMRLTSTGLGIGTSSPQTRLEANQTGVGSVVIPIVAANQDTSTTGTGAGIGFVVDGVTDVIGAQIAGIRTASAFHASALAMYTRDSAGGGLLERMRLDSSGNLGLGVTPSAGIGKLQVRAGTSATGNSALFDNADGTYNTYLQIQHSSAGVKLFNSNSFGGAANNLIFGNGTTAETMRLDSSGNLGLGVTPSAWSGVGGVFEIKGNAYIYSTTGVLSAGANAFFNGTNWIYKTTQAASRYEQVNGVHQWGIAPSGTAGNAISFTQAMTLDASGNLGVGQTSPLCRLDVRESNRANSTNIANVGVYTTSSPAIDFGGSIVLGGRFNSGNQSEAPFASIRGAKENGTNNNYSGYLAFQTIQDGNVLAERARITSGGDLLVGTTSSAGERLRVTASANNQAVYVVNTNATANGTIGGIYINYTGAAPNSTGFEFLRGDDTGNNRFGMRSNGGLANYSGNDVNLSDRREKTNFAPAKSYLDTICAIPVQTFNYIDQSEDDPGLTLGVVAQDVQAVAPELVMESNWGTAEEPKQRLSIYQTDMQYALMKCIQELKAELDTVKAELATLKGQP